MKNLLIWLGLGFGRVRFTVRDSRSRFSTVKVSIELGLRFRPSEQRTFGTAQFLTHFNDVLFPAYLLTSPS